MKADELFDIIGDADDRLIADAEHTGDGKRRFVWIKWGIAAAACLCLIAVSGVMYSKNRTANKNHIQAWNTTFAAEQYFRYSALGEMNTDAMDSVVELPYAESRFFSDNRRLLEENAAIPVMNQDSTFTARADYNSDGNIYSVMLMWHFDADIAEYSNLSVTVGCEEVPEIRDCIEVELDDKGNIMEPGVTVTERDGVRIVATGHADSKKYITFQNDGGWYRITGSWNDSYESVGTLLNWFWEHPLDFTFFQMEKGDRYTGSNLQECPDAFSEYLPDFRASGFLLEVSTVELKNGEPVSLEAHYVSNVTEEELESGRYDTGENGAERIHWCINAEPGEYRLRSGCRLENLSREQVTGMKPVDEVTTETRIEFVQGNCLVTVYTTDLEAVWQLIESLK